MNVLESIYLSFNSYLEQTFALDGITLPAYEFTLNTDENKQDFGDINSNIALILAKALKQNPRDIATQISQDFKHSYITKIEPAGPGFLNLFFTRQALHDLCTDLFIAQDTFFKLSPTDPKYNYSIEFVSGNPTGPLHLGNGRGGIIGDVLGNILTFIGHKATKEYYINDAGNQIAKLGVSFKTRCLQAAGTPIEMPEEGYHGTYLIDLAQAFIAEHGTKHLDTIPQSTYETYAKDRILAMIKETLHDYGIDFDVWFSEKTLHESGAIAHALEILDKKGHLYEKDGALWFASSKFGDDKDRVVRKSTGELTYAAADIAYLMNKVERGFNHLVMILGHDHHSYAIRLQGIMQALELTPENQLDVILYQLVKMKAGGEQVRMSKRAAHIVTLKDVIETVGKDVARFFYLNRKADAQLEFDLDLALKKTEENPVYYAQYAYVRTKSIIEKAQEVPDFADIIETDVSYIGTHESLIIKKIISLKSLLKTISLNHQTHLLTYYILELAHLFHKYYSHNRVIDVEHIAQSRSRLLLVTLVRNTFATVLDLLEISKPDRM